MEYALEEGKLCNCPNVLSTVEPTKEEGLQVR